MAAIDFGDQMQSDFERVRQEIMNHFLGELLDHYVTHDEIQAGQTLELYLEVVDNDDNPELPINEQWGFSSN